MAWISGCVLQGPLCAWVQSANEKRNNSIPSLGLVQPLLGCSDLLLYLAISATPVLLTRGLCNPK